MNVFEGYTQILHKNTDSIWIIINGAHHHTLTYDKGRPTGYKTMNSVSRLWEYDSSGRLVNMKIVGPTGEMFQDVKGIESILSYNRQGQFSVGITKEYPKSDTENWVTLTYDSEGRLKVMLSETGDGKKSELQHYTYDQDTVEIVSSALRDSATEREMYLREKYVYKKGKMVAGERVYLRGGVPKKYYPKSYYSYEDDSVMTEQVFTIHPPKAPQLSRTVTTSFNKSGQPVKIVISFPGKKNTKSILYTYSVEGQLKSEIIKREEPSKDAVILQRTEYTYGDKGMPQNVKYFRRRKDSLVLHSDVSFKFYKTE